MGGRDQKVPCPSTSTKTNDPANEVYEDIESLRVKRNDWGELGKNLVLRHATSHKVASTKGRNIRCTEYVNLGNSLRRMYVKHSSVKYKRSILL